MLTRTNDLFERWHHFKKWECVNNGMWKSKRNDMNKVQECARLLADPVECLKAMEMAVDKYPISAEQHLSKQDLLRRKRMLKS